MDLVLFSAIPKVALFFLLLVGLAILAEIIYLAKKKLDSQEVTLPKSLQNPSSLPLQPAVVSVTTEVISETPKKGRLTRKTTMIILSTLLIAITIPVGLVLVKQRQVVEKQAAGCIMLWPAKPGTTCANEKLSPANGATNVSLTPDFIWDYGGYRDGDTGVCVQPSGCTGYYANVSVWEGSSTAGTRLMGCGAVQDSNGNPPKSCNWVSFYASPLKPNTQYTWRVEPGTSGGSHALHDWNYHFTTGGSTPPPVILPTPVPVTLNCNDQCIVGSPTRGTCSDNSLTCTLTGEPIPTPSAPCRGGPCPTQPPIARCRNSQCATQTSCVCPTTPPNPECSYLRAYDGNWQQITNLATIQSGQVVYFAAKGTGQISSVTFHINNGAAQVSSNLHNGEFYIQYTVPAAGTYTVDATINPGFPPD